MFFKSLTFIIMTAITLIILWGLGWVWFASALAFQDKANPPAKSEAIIVLTGGNGRINAGLDLLKEKTAPVLFISGVHKGTAKDDIYDSWQKGQTKPCCVELGYKATDTSENAKEVYEWVTDKKIKSFILVTSQYHMPRAYMEISMLLPEAKITRYAVHSDDFKPWEGRFWSLTISEYNKTLIQWIRLKTA